ncbi:MAG: radical SAM protein [bacterium]
MNAYTIFLFSVSSKSAILDLGIFNLKAYLSQDETVSHRIKVVTRIFKPRSYSHHLGGFMISVPSHYLRRIADEIKSHHPHMVGFSCSVKNFDVMIQVARYIKRESPTTLIVFGGPEIHQELVFSPEKDIRKGPIDIAVLHDGEITFARLVNHILEKKPLHAISDIYFKKNGKLYRTRRGSASNLSLLPSPFLTHSVPSIGKKTTKSVIENSRGCPFRCSYCTYPLSYFGTLRYFPLEKTLQELRFLLEKKIKLLFIVDDNFDIFPQRSMAILKTYLGANSSTQLMVYFNASRQIIGKEFVTLLAKSHIIITIGVQTTNKHALALANRNTNLATLETNLRTMDKAGVKYRLEFIEGLPGDSYETIKSTIDWLFRFRASHVFFYRLLILKGTSFQQNTKRLGITYEQRPPFMIRKTKTFSPTDLVRSAKLCFTVSTIYNTPRTRRLLELTASRRKLPVSTMLEEIAQNVSKSKNNSEKHQVESVIQKNIMKWYTIGAHARAKN